MKKLLSLILLTLASCAAPTTGPSTDAGTSQTHGNRGVLVMAHGGSDEWNAAVEQTVAPLRAEMPVAIAFGMARPSTMAAAVRALEDQGVDEIAVVRMFISGDSFLERTERILGLRKPMETNAMNGMSHTAEGGHGMEPARPIPTQSVFRVSHTGVADSQLVDNILADRVRALSTDPALESVLILAHGPGDEAENERWLANMRLRVQQVHKIGPFRHVQVETLREDWTGRRREAERRIRDYVEASGHDGGRVVVVPFRIAGFGPYRDVLEGLEYVADGKGFCPHSAMTVWIAEQARRCFSE